MWASKVADPAVVDHLLALLDVLPCVQAVLAARRVA